MTLLVLLRSISLLVLLLRYQRIFCHEKGNSDCHENQSDSDCLKNQSDSDCHNNQNENCHESQGALHKSTEKLCQTRFINPPKNRTKRVFHPKIRTKRLS